MRISFILLLLNYAACAIAQTPQESFDAGLLKYKAGDYRKAESEFTNAILSDAKFVQAWRYRGLSKMQLSNYSGALEDFDMMVKLDSTQSLGYYNRATAKVKLSDSEGALTDVSKSIALKSDFADACFFRAGA